MFRLITAITLLVAFAIQNFHKGGIVMGYYLDNSPYAKNCENKAKPVLKCNGKCQMAKKIMEEQKREEQAPERKSENKFQTIWSKSSFEIFPVSNNPLIRVYTSYLVRSKLSPHLAAIFHPPCLV